MSGIDEQPVEKLEKPLEKHEEQLNLYSKLFQEYYGYECKSYVYKVEE